MTWKDFLWFGIGSNSAFAFGAVFDGDWWFVTACITANIYLSFNVIAMQGKK